MGKTYVARKVLAFLLIFAGHHLGERLREDRYYLSFCGVKHDLVIDHCKKMEQDIEKAVELFNKKHPESPIITPDVNKELSNKVNKKQYNRRINGQEISYSAFDGLSMTADVNAGFTSHFIFVDEAQEVLDEKFNIQVKPFLTRTGGCLYAIG